MISFKSREQNLLSFDLSQKHLFYSSFSIPFFAKASFSLTDKKLSSNLFRAPPLLFLLFNFDCVLFKLTKIKHPVSVFKTQKNANFGLKSILNKNNSVLLFQNYIDELVFDFITSGHKPTVGFNKFNSFTVSFPSFKYLHFFFETDLSSLSSALGGDLSFFLTAKNNQKASGKVFTYLSGFCHLTYYQNENKKK